MVADSNIRGGSVPHLNRMQDSSYHSTPVTFGAKRSSSCLTYTSLSRMHNVVSTSTPDTQVETSAIHTAEDQNPDLSINDARYVVCSFVDSFCSKSLPQPSLSPKFKLRVMVMTKSHRRS